MNELFCYEVTERLKARFDTTHQNFEVFQRVPLARRPTQSQRGSATPSRWLPLATDSKGSNLAAATAVLVAFRIGPFHNFQHKFTISYSNHGPNLLSWRYKQFAKLEFGEVMDVCTNKKKMIAPIIITVIMVLYYVVYFGFLITLLPSIWKYALGIIPLGFSVVMVKVCIERINEIKKGEEDDISKY